MRDNGFARAQAAYERMQPPGWDDPDYAEDCDDGTCGECRSCVTAAADDYYVESEAERRHGY